MALNSDASILATVCNSDGKVKLWDAKRGVYSYILLKLTHTGTTLQEIIFKSPYNALFFNHSPNKLIVACSDKIFIVDASTQSTKPFSDTPQRTFYCPHALALSDDDTVFVAGCNSTFGVFGYDAVSCTKLCIHNTIHHVGALCMLGAHVLVTVYNSPMLVLDSKTGLLITTLHMVDGYIFGLGVIEGCCLIFLYVISSQTSTPPCTLPCSNTS